jgi:hypothetical protein
MGKVLAAVKSVASHLESKTYKLLIFLLLGLVLGFGIFFVLDGWQFVGVYFSRAMRKLTEILQTKLIFSWLSGILAGISALVLLYSVIRHMDEKNDDPLFSPKIAMLFLIVMMRVSWEIPNVHRTFYLAFNDTSGISQIVMIVMAIGLVVICFQFFTLRREYASFVDIRNRVKRVSGTGDWNLVQSMTIMDGAQGLLKSKWQNIKVCFEKNLSSEYETLISFPDQAELLKESKISFIIKILPVLGMIGTVLGFTVAVVGMQSAAANMNDFSSFKGNLIEALGGMKTAFLTTLVGMVAMVLVMWVNALIDESRRRILLQEAEFLYIRFFLPGQKPKTSKNEPPESPGPSLP